MVSIRYWLKTITLLLSIFLTATGCNTEKSCNENTEYPYIALQLHFNKVYESLGRQRVKDSILSNITVKWPSYYMDTVKVSTIKLPLSQNVDTSAYEILINNNPSDIIYVTYTRNKVFISYDCGFRTDFNLDTLVSLNNKFDSIKIIKPLVTDANENHIEIYLNTPDTTSITE